MLTRTSPEAQQAATTAVRPGGLPVHAEPPLVGRRPPRCPPFVGPA